ncbi:two-component regulator propeller domain-containing protein [Flammeovirgaceae bacterium SG7u.111]|nr:two-component regulator propeller domain-containing protein [Flammeovirgaceae bacterium SG7u.132]WPO35986.1 two-component regulator propeller domain-containing protein [Flammeovirgaceae bacterium SG7u.111]
MIEINKSNQYFSVIIRRFYPPLILLGYAKGGLTFFFILINSFLALAQPPVAFKNFTVENGLSDNLVKGFYQDGRGVMWLATDDGLNRYDGNEFVVFKNDASDSTSISHDNILEISDGLHNDIWLATWGGGISIMDLATERFKRLVHAEGDTTSIPTNFIYKVFKDSKNRIWAGTYGHGLLLFDTSSYEVLGVYKPLPDYKDFSHNRVNKIIEGKEGKLIVGTLGNGLFEFDPEKKEFSSRSEWRSLSTAAIEGLLYEKEKDRLWVSALGDGLYLFEADGELMQFKCNVSDPRSLPDNQVWDIVKGENGRVWVATDGGLALYNEADHAFYCYYKNKFDSKSLGSNILKSLYVDSENRLWVGTFEKGFSLFDEVFVTFEHIYENKNNLSLSGNEVSGVLEDGDGNVWIGVDGGGLDFYDRSSNSIINYSHDPKDPNSLFNNKVKTLFMDSKSQLWIGFWNGGIDRFDPKENRFVHYKDQNRGTTANENVISIAEDDLGNLWLATFGGGVVRFNTDTDEYEYFLPTNSGISSEKVNSINYHNGKIWVGSNVGNIDCINSLTGKVIGSIENLGGNNFFPTCLKRDSKDRLWAGTEGGGLLLIDEANMNCKAFTTEEGLSSNTIQAIEEDASGNLWLSTNNGINRFDPSTLTTTASYGLKYGLQGLRFNHASSCVLSSGKMIFGGGSGLNLFHPDSVSKSQFVPPIFFSNFEVFNKTVKVGDSPILPTQINEVETLMLNHKQSLFSITYSALDFSAIEEVDYRYRLLGFVDESWQEVGKSRKATYSNLLPNDYIFEVGTVGADGEVSNSRTLSITITPPWWRTWWFGFLLLIASSGVFFGVVYLRIRSIEKQKGGLEKLVQERTDKLIRANGVLRDLNEIIRGKNEEIQAQSTELEAANFEVLEINQRLEEMVDERTEELKKSNKELDNFVYRVSHDIRAPLSSVMGLVNILENEKDPGQIPTYLKLIDQSVKKLDVFVGDILDYSRNTRMELVKEPIDFPVLFSEVIDDLQYMEKASHLNIDICHLSEPFEYESDPKRLKIVFRNLISNAIKYQNMFINDSYLKVEFEKQESELVMTFSDNGIGIEENKIRQVFNMFFKASEISVGSGIGLYIVKETMDKLEGKITVSSEINTGTTFVISLPLS